MNHYLKLIVSIGIVSGALACATAGPSPQLLRARDAFERAKSGPALELNPADVHDALNMLNAAEAASAADPTSADAVNRAYLAEKRAQLADAQGKTSVALRERERAEKELAALKDAALIKAQGQLAKASSDQERTDAQLVQTQSQLGKEHRALVAADARSAADKEQQGLKDEDTKEQLAQAAASDARAQEQLAQKQAQLDEEHTARLASDQRAQDSFAALAKVVAIRKEERGTVITLSGSVVFASGKSDLLPSAQQRLDQVAVALRAGDRPILIEGHSDSHGAAAFNQELSERRARSVLDYLVSRSVPAGRVRSVGLGSSRSVADNTSAEGRANNRRVEIVIEALHAN